jgi:hypothetical protein
MEVRIGIAQSPRDLSFESALSPKELTAKVEQALEAGQGVLKFEDEKGKTIIVPTAAIAYVEIGSEKSRSVGFIA